MANWRHSRTKRSVKRDETLFAHVRGGPDDGRRRHEPGAPSGRDDHLVTR
jgi:hypothetical protein